MPVIRYRQTLGGLNALFVPPNFPQAMFAGNITAKYGMTDAVYSLIVSKRDTAVRIFSIIKSCVVYRTVFHLIPRCVLHR